MLEVKHKRNIFMMNEEQMASYTPQPPVKSRRSFKPFLVILFAVVILGGLGATGYYMYQRNQSLKSDVAARDAKITTLKKQVANLSTQNSSSDTSAKSDNTLDIRELGVSLTLPDSLKDISYSYNGISDADSSQKVSTVAFSTKALTDSDSACAAAGSVPPLGKFTKVSGQFVKSSTDADTSGNAPTLVKQFKDFYIAYVGSADMCSSTVDASAVANALKDFKDTFSTIKQLSDV